LHRASDLVAYASDASPYRLIPKAVGQGDGILVDVRRHFGGVDMLDDACPPTGPASWGCSTRPERRTDRSSSSSTR
jgi:hypothetical protein